MDFSVEERECKMSVYMPWDASWQTKIVYLNWFQPEIPGMEDSPVLPAYPAFSDYIRGNGGGKGLFPSIASAMVFLLGHDPEAAINTKYCEWLNVYSKDLSRQLLLEGTDMASKGELTQAIWMLQASMLLNPDSYETHYNLALAYRQLALTLSKEEKDTEARECSLQAEQYFQNASQLENTAGIYDMTSQLWSNRTGSDVSRYNS